jgi:hypothetical protein
MSHSKINFFIDLWMLISFIISIVTSLILFFFLPTGVRRGAYQEFLGIIKQNWVNLHTWVGLILIILITLHLVLHLNWIVSMIKSLAHKKNKN